MALQACTHPYFGFASAIFPSIVEECDSAIDRLMDDLYRRFFIWCFAQMVAAKSQR